MHLAHARTPEHTPSLHAGASAAGSSSMHKPTPKKTPGQFTPGFSRAQDDDIDEWQPPPPVDKHNENEPGDAVRTYDSYREYDKDPLTEPELRSVLSKLGVEARTLLRKRDKAYKEHGLTGTESDDTLVPLIAANPTLLQRPIGVTCCRMHHHTGWLIDHENVLVLKDHVQR